MKTEKSLECKIHIALSKDVHRRLRVKCALEDITLQDYVEGLLKCSVKNLKITNKNDLTVVQDT